MAERCTQCVAGPRIDEVRGTLHDLAGGLEADTDTIWEDTLTALSSAKRARSPADIARIDQLHTVVLDKTTRGMRIAGEITAIVRRGMESLDGIACTGPDDVGPMGCPKLRILLGTVDEFMEYCETDVPEVLEDGPDQVAGGLTGQV